MVDDVRIYEKLCLEGFQAGLSWLTILRKREGFRRAFAGFEPATVAGFGPDDVARLLGDAAIVRHRGKIEATIANARATLDVQRQNGSLAALVWRFEPPPGPPPATMADLPASTPESVDLSRELRRRGFRFVGPTTVYAAMQSLGVIATTWPTATSGPSWKRNGPRSPVPEKPERKGCARVHMALHCECMHKLACAGRS
ncbi:MAG: DNA-3-methyladenine glycosylase [Actinomycetota bacterium]|nr:DNA-3-methyladenine glycosylase [Actinomycetota bacterium]